MSMGITMNYLQAISISGQRKNHKLKRGWGVLCQWFEGLPLFKTFMIKEGDDL